MIDLKDLLGNDMVKNVLGKIGVDQDKADDVADAAISAISSKFSEHGPQMVSMLSQNENTEDDNKLENEIEESFLGNLQDKVGISDAMISQLKGAAIPMILNFLREKLGGEEGGVMSMITSFFSTDSKSDENGGGLLGGLGDKISKFF